MHLSRFPRIRFVHGPTPREPMTRLSALLGGPNLYVKRDDCTGLAGGGNKTRKLEFLMAEAEAQGCDTVITYGAVQSNHAHQTAAAAAFVGMKCEILLERRVPGRPEVYDTTGNVFLDRLLGAVVTYFPADHDMNAAAEEIAERVRAAGGRAYIIPGGGSSPTGALGYVSCAQELLYQAHDMDLRIDHIVHASGSGGTQGGLAAGLQAMNAGIPLTGISVRWADRAKQEANVLAVAEGVADKLGLSGLIDPAQIVVDTGYVGAGYGQSTPEMVEAVTLTARHEGILLDPVYTGKGMAGLIGLIRAGRFGPDDNVVFVYTGGSAALFAYEDEFA